MWVNLLNNLNSGREGDPDWKLSSSNVRPLDGRLRTDKRVFQSASSVFVACVVWNLRRKWQPTPIFLPGESREQVARWAALHRFARSRTRLKRLSMHACIGEGSGNLLEYSRPEKPRDRGAWWAALCVFTQSQTRLKCLAAAAVVWNQGSVGVKSFLNFHLLQQARYRSQAHLVMILIF